jgi:hypothetical protein
MNDQEALRSKGWRLISGGRGKYHNINYWDHPNHQPLYRGCFTQSEALHHQKMLDKGYSCSCIPKEEEARSATHTRSHLDDEKEEE